MKQNAATAHVLSNIAAFVFIVVALFGVGLSLVHGHGLAGEAFADELDDAWADLNAKTTELESLTYQVNEAKQNVEAAKAELEAVSDSISASQDNLIQVQKQLSAVTQLMYKTDELNMIRILASSESLGELIERIVQLEAVATQAANYAREEKETQQMLAEQYGQASHRKDDALAAEQELEQKRNALESSKEALEARIAELEEEAALAAAAAEAAAALEAANRAAEEAAAAQNAVVYDSSASTEEVATGLAPDEAPAPAATEEVQAEQQQEVQSYPSGDTTGWSSGVASAYGGSSDPSTPNPGTTATGAVCDDYSMGVAVPLAWGPRAYYGRRVEISYNGMTVVATVNDCGGMGGGSRSLDLQPGVFKAFGFSTCQEWGVREVQYRFL